MQKEQSRAEQSRAEVSITENMQLEIVNTAAAVKRIFLISLYMF